VFNAKKHKIEDQASTIEVYGSALETHHASKGSCEDALKRVKREALEAREADRAALRSATARINEYKASNSEMGRQIRDLKGQLAARDTAVVEMDQERTTALGVVALRDGAEGTSGFGS
jgi:chromosome segregation ATPase